MQRLNRRWHHQGCCWSGRSGDGGDEEDDDGAGEVHDDDCAKFYCQRVTILSARSDDDEQGIHFFFSRLRLHYGTPKLVLTCFY